MLPTRVLPARFVLHKRPTRHARLVEECRLLDVRDSLAALPPSDQRQLSVWYPLPEHPWLRLVRHDAGRIRRWWFACPRCQRRCETLYRPPEACSEYDWRCRRCWRLTYVSQYGSRHPLRHVLTPRKQVSRQRAGRRLQRRGSRLDPEGAEAPRR